MMRFPCVATCALLSLLLSVSPHPGQAGDSIRQRLVRLDDVLQTATKNYDGATLARLITDDYVLVASNGHVYDRRAFLADAVDRSAKYEINQPEDVTVRSYNGDTALVTGVLHIRYRYGTKLVDARVRFGDVWIKEGAMWRYAYGQASPLKK